jgi:hypothetical protein
LHEGARIEPTAHILDGVEVLAVHVLFSELQRTRCTVRNYD